LFCLQPPPGSLEINPYQDAKGATLNKQNRRKIITKKSDTKKQPLQSFKAFGIDASVGPQQRVRRD
jgi:hypothetical protein